MKTLIISPTYNESKNIATLIHQVFNRNPDYHMLIVDDSSPDGTSKIVEEFMLSNSNINIIKRKSKNGLGSAYIEGFKYALNNNYDYVMQIDADLSHNPEDLGRLKNKSTTYDLVIGSRYINGISIVNWPLSRLILSYFANLYARLITGVPIKDLTAGFKAWKSDTLHLINFNECSSQGYCFQIETTFRASQKNCKIKEHPITFTDRTVGESKMDRSVVIEAILKVWLFGFWRLFRLKR